MNSEESKPQKSLLDPADGQGELFDLEKFEEHFEDLDTREGAYTGERLHRNHPRLYQAIVSMLASNQLGIRAIAKLLKVHVKTVMGVRDREGVSIATEKERLSKLMMDAAGLSLEVVVDRLATLGRDNKLNLRDLLVGAGIAVDKALLLAGEATHRVEVVVTEPDHDDYNRAIEEAIEAECVETGRSPEKSEQKEGPALPALPAPDPGDQGDDQAYLGDQNEPPNKE